VRVVVDRVSKTYPDRRGASVTALNAVSVVGESEEFVALLGPSGCGKSTLLNLVAGLVTPTEGRVYFEGRRSPGRPITAMVFQEGVRALPLAHGAGQRRVRARRDRPETGRARRPGPRTRRARGGLGGSKRSTRTSSPEACGSPGTAEAQGFGKILAWGGDHFPWQIAAIFYSRKLAGDRARATNFMKGYVKSARYYFDAVLVQKDGRVVPGAHYDDVVAITAKHTGARPEIIRLGFPYQDRNGRLLVEDIGKQIDWWVKNEFMKSTLPVREVVDTSFIGAAIQAVKE
jgi:ABC transporter